jgi:hypothetical protein
VLGSPQIAGVQVRGMRSWRPDTVPAQSPALPAGMGWVAVTEQEVAVVEMELGLRARKPGRVLARVPRGDIASVEVGKGVDRPLMITFADGAIWQFELPNPGFLAVSPKLNTYKQGQHVADVLNGAA